MRPKFRVDEFFACVPAGHLRKNFSVKIFAGYGVEVDPSIDMSKVHAVDDISDDKVAQMNSAFKTFIDAYKNFNAVVTE